MSRYKAYSEYKSSGVDNLGEIPCVWEVMQLKRSVLDCVNGIWGSEPENDGNDTIVIRVADFDRPRLSIVDDGFTYRKIDSKEKRSRLLNRGDLLLEKSGGGEKTLVGQVVRFDKDFAALTSNFVAKMTPHPSFSGSYLNYVFSRFYSSNINYCSIKQNTGIQNLDSASYLSEKFGFPPLPEQEKIAFFLDHETAKIDTLIEKQQRLIELLKEKRQAVISHAVTKGLNPKATMKDSGVAWLGRIPRHWAISKLRYKFAFGKGLTITKENLVEDGIPCVNYGEVHSKFGFEVNPTKHSLKCVDESYLKAFSNCLLSKGDFVFADTSEDLDGSGNFTQLTSDTVTFAGYHTIIARPEGRKNTRYFAYLFDAKEFRTQIQLAVKGVKVFSITQAILRGADIWLPSDDEQKNIVAFLDHETAKIDALIEKQQRLIELLKEKRQAVISHAVTGKIDVRDWQADA